MTTAPATKEKARTDAIRRKAARRGHKVIKGRRRGAGFMLLDDRRACVLGSWHDATLDQIERYLDNEADMRAMVKSSKDEGSRRVCTSMTKADNGDQARSAAALNQITSALRRSA